MRKWTGLLLWVFAGMIFVCGLGVLAIVLLFSTLSSISGNHTYTLEEIGQAIKSPIPADATDVQYSSETRYGYFIKLSFKAPPDSVSQFSSKICQGKLYEGYDPFNSVDNVLSGLQRIIMKSEGYVYFSSSPNTPNFIYGNRCELESTPIQVKIDQSNPKLYQVHVEVFAFTHCAFKISCKGYALENSLDRPLPKSSPFPLVVYGFRNKQNTYFLHGNQLCIETEPGLYNYWGKEFNLNNMKGASFELFVDDVSKGQAVISEQGRLSVDYSTGQFIGIHESPEFCFQVDAKDGVHQMSVDVKTRSGQSYHYAWPFTVQTSTSALAE